MSARSPAPPGSHDTTQTRDVTGHGAEEQRFALLVGSSSRVEMIPLLAGDTFIMGRDPECDIMLPEATMSRRHARLRLGERITLEDLGSKNGTRVQGSRVEAGARTDLSVGTAFELGAVTFVLQRGAAARTSPQVQEASARRRIGGAHFEALGVEDGGREPIVADRGMRRLFGLIELIAPSPLAVLVLGESGVGKEVYAREVHRRSTRAEYPFLPIPCGALTESMLEAELFGYEPGAFADATQAKEGLFEAADGGTVFLDAIGDMPLATQAKLLRVLETGAVTRLGSAKPRHIDVRIVSATHRDLRELMAAQTFRADLYFRLNGMSVTLPPLRARRSDIVPLANHWIERAARAMRKRPCGLTTRAVARLEDHPWPGNVRELRNLVERAVVLARGGRVDVEHLSRASRSDPLRGRGTL